MWTARKTDSGEEYGLETNDGGTAKDQTPRQSMLAITSTSTENVVNEVGESAPGQGEEHEAITIE